MQFLQREQSSMARIIGVTNEETAEPLQPMVLMRELKKARK